MLAMGVLMLKVSESLKAIFSLSIVEENIVVVPLETKIMFLLPVMVVMKVTVVFILVMLSDMSVHIVMFGLIVWRYTISIAKVSVTY